MAALVSLCTLLPGASELYRGAQEATAQVGTAQMAQTQEVANALLGTLGLIERQIGAVTALPWEPSGWLTQQQRRAEFQRLLKIAPAVTSIRQMGRAGELQLLVSRRDLDYLGSLPTRPHSMLPSSTSYGDAIYEDDYDPVVEMSISGADDQAGITVARLNLRLLVAELDTSFANATVDVMVSNRSGRLLMHRITSYMLEQRRIAEPLRASLSDTPIRGMDTPGLDGTDMIASVLPMPQQRWWVVVMQPRAIAMAPVIGRLWRTAAYLAGALALALVAATYLATRTTRPVIALHRGATALGRGDLAARVDVRTGDELEDVAAQFNHMAAALQDSVATLESKVAEKTAALETANRHKSEFLANMSHELRTPLNAVIGFSEALDEEMFGTLNPKQREYVNDIHGSGNHLLALINDILDLSKIEAGRLDLELTAFHVPQALDNAIILVRERCQRAGLRLVREIDPRLGSWVADERRFKQIVLNLLSNACKFTPPGGTIALHARVHEMSLHVGVADTGVGIAPDDIARAFEEFRQVGGNSAHHAEGTGLGLSLVKRLVELHGGSVDVTSVVQQGTTVRFTIPQRPA